ncbi:hypothetical protein HC776_01920 [bacterium]|nr:hypothetical protein [bacterium]
MSALEDLLNSLFETRSAPLAAELEGWMRASRRYKEFVTRYRGKIRTKLKTVRDVTRSQGCASRTLYCRHAAARRAFYTRLRAIRGYEAARA